jgi:hypothetical protein
MNGERTEGQIVIITVNKIVDVKLSAHEEFL